MVTEVVEVCNTVRIDSGDLLPNLDIKVHFA